MLTVLFALGRRDRVVAVAQRGFSRRGQLSRAKSGVDPSYALYVGDRACSECHPGEAALHSRSGHSRTFASAGRIMLARHTGWSHDRRSRAPGRRLEIPPTNGQLWTERTEKGTVERFVIEYAFGSGRHATTFVTMLDRDPRRPVCREHRLTFFAHSASPGV